MRITALIPTAEMLNFRVYRLETVLFRCKGLLIVKIWPKCFTKVLRTADPIILNMTRSFLIHIYIYIFFFFFQALFVSQVSILCFGFC